MLKKLVASFASLAMVLGTASTALAVFNDVPSWAQEAVDALVDKGAIDGSRPSYRSNDSINRDEFTKLAVQLALDGTDPAVISAEPTFNDVGKDDWSYDWVETAVGYAIVNGYDDGSFRPGNKINRAEAATIIERAFALPSMTEPAEPYSDVQATDWFAADVTTLVNHCVLDGSKPTFQPSREMNRAEAAMIFYSAWRASNGEDLCAGEPVDNDTDDDTVLNDVDNCPTIANTDQADADADGVGDVCEGATGPATSTLEVEISPASPPSRTVPLGGNRVPFLVLNVKATGDEDVKLNAITVDVTGLGDDDCITGLGVYENNTRHGNIKSIASDTRLARINMASDAVITPAGSSTEVVIAADLESTGTCTGDEFAAEILNAASVEATGKTSGGVVPVTVTDAPIVGETQKIGSIGVGTLTVKGRSLNKDTCDIGERCEVSRFALEAGPEEDLTLQRIELEQEGGLNNGDLTDCTLEYNNTELSGPVDQVDDGLSFDLTKNGTEDGYPMQDGDTRTMSVFCTPVDGVGQTIQFGVKDEFSDAFLALGSKFGFAVSVDEGAGPDVFPNIDDVLVRGGQINFASSSVARDIPTGGNDITMGTFIISNADAAVLIKGFDLNVDVSGGADASDFTDLKFVDTETNTVVAGPEDGTGVGDQVLTYTDDFELDTNKTLTLELRGDTDETAPTGGKVTFSILMNTVELQGVDNNKKQTGTTGTNFKLAPSSPVATKQLTLAQPGVDIVKKTLANDTVVARSKEVVFWQGTFTAREASPVKITRLGFTLTNGNGGTEDNLENCEVVTKLGSVTTVQQSGESINGGVVNFNELDSDGEPDIFLEEGEQVLVQMKCDVASTLSNGSVGGDDTATFSLSATDAEDGDGDTADVTTLPIASGATLTLVDRGTLSITRETSESADPMIVLENATNVDTAAFRFNANKEDAAVNDLTVKIDGLADDLDGDLTNDTYDCDGVPSFPPTVITCYKDAVDSVMLYYKDGTAVQTTGGGAVVANSIDSTGRADLKNMDLIIDKDEDSILFVRTATSPIADTDIGRSGMTFRAALILNEGTDDFDITGADSGTDYTTVGAVGSGANIETDVGTAGLETTSAGNLMYLLNNSLTVTKPTGQQTLLTIGTAQELLKFTVTPTGSNTTYIKSVIVDVTKSDNDADASLVINNVDLYSGSTKIGDGTVVGTTWTILIDPAYAQKVTIGGVDFDAVNTGGETYLIKADVAGVEVDDVATTTMKINSIEPGTDGLVFRDYGTTGLDGVNVRWVDLGAADESTSQIQNRIDNK